MRQRWADLLFGAPERTLLEQRIVSMTALLVCLTGILSTLQNILLDIPIIQNLFSGGAAGAGAGFYWLSRSRKHYERTAGLMFIFFLLLLGSGWYATNGSYGTMPYFFFMLFVISLILFRRLLRLVAVFSVTVLLGAIIVLEYRFPDFLIPYQSLISRYSDITVGLFISMAITGILVSLVVREFRSERERNARLLIDTLQNKRQLEIALQEIKVLKQSLPICAHCKKIKNEDGAWHDIATYISHHTDTIFSHGLCPDCAVLLYPEYLLGDDDTP